MPRTSVKLIEDSIHNGYRLTTLELEYPYYIHAEFMTHRVFSRNAQSFRAIPFDKLIQRIEDNKWYPIWVKNNPGMEAKEFIESNSERVFLNNKWDKAKEAAIHHARILYDLGIHKQIVNRIIMPFTTIKVIVSATEWNNFFRLRIHPAAQQEIQELAILMKDALINSDPKKLDLGEWHLPYLTESEREMPPDIAAKLSAARCARVSYLNHDGTRDLKKDFDLHDQLKHEKHMSPFEHQAYPFSSNTGGNFRGWRQYRWEIENS